MNSRLTERVEISLGGQKRGNGGLLHSSGGWGRGLVRCRRMKIKNARAMPGK